MTTNDANQITANDYLSDELVNFAFPEEQSSELKVIGIGGGGCNAVNHMYHIGVSDVELIVCNTDSQALENSPVSSKIQLGQTLTGGRGAGGKPEIGRQAAIESLDEILEKVRGNTDMAFLTAGMGGGSGTGAIPVIAEKIKEIGILTVAIVTVPFKTEIGNRLEYAKKGIEELEEAVDALIIIENEKLHDNYADLPLSEAFTKADEVLATAVQSIIEIIKVHGVINVDFNDIKTVMSNSKVALMGSGIADGDERAMKAVELAMNSPLISSNNISDAKNILINIVSGEKEIFLSEHNNILKFVQKISGHGADNFISGSARDKSIGESVKVTLIATGFSTKSVQIFQKESKVDLNISKKKKKDAKTDGKQISKDEPKQTFMPDDATNKKDTNIDPDKKKKKKKKNIIDLRYGIQKVLGFFDEDLDYVEDDEPTQKDGKTRDGRQKPDDKNPESDAFNKN
ncbi:MAG: cell division protein FtsZ [Bacteroidota bacterium]|nr:cell division protein FtsZ [Bacteroidota bacterium]